MSTRTETTSGTWVTVEEELPPPGVTVSVDGIYIAPGTGHPTAYRCRCLFMKGEHWESREWRGMVGIRRWWKITPTPEQLPTT